MFVPRSWMCKKLTSVSQSSTESEVASLDAGLRLDGIPALDLWDLVIDALHSSQNIPVRRNSVARRNPKQTHQHQHQHQSEEAQQPR